MATHSNILACRVPWKTEKDEVQRGSFCSQSWNVSGGAEEWSESSLPKILGFFINFRSRAGEFWR